MLPRICFTITGNGELARIDKTRLAMNQLLKLGNERGCFVILFQSLLYNVNIFCNRKMEEDKENISLDCWGAVYRP